MSRVWPRSSEANSWASPSDTTITPTICTIVARRKNQSSVSYADANHV
jgi:hypothetical protein